ncbi:MAG: PQQ-dependent sugar dehydrogenase [Candidatus Thermoplasmatota archaeon]
MRWLAFTAIIPLLAGCSELGGVGGNGGSDSRVDIDLQPFLSGLDDPVFLTHAADGSGRLFIVEQKGIILVWDDGLQEEPFLDIAAGGAHAKVLAGGERGLLGLAFHPAYADNGRFFVYYTAPGGDVTIEEYANPEPAGNEADPASGHVVLSQDHSKYANHNGGMLAFGPDGMLYAGLGDGGAGGDPDNNAQNLDTLLGKIVRLDVDTAPPPIPYTIPQGNPFANRAGKDEVWAFGLRNPWRFSFDRGAADGAGAGDLWIGDVGQNKWEEIDHAEAGTAGVNYGWSRFEGTHVYDAARQAPAAVEPVVEYDHSAGGASHCSVTGGYVYRGAEVSGLQGTYLFGDYCSGFVWTLTRTGEAWVMALALDTNLNVTSFGEGEDGELYVVDHGGDIRKVVAA